MSPNTNPTPPPPPPQMPDANKVIKAWQEMVVNSMGDAAKEMEQDVKDFGRDISSKLHSEALGSTLYAKAFQINAHMQELDDELAKGVEARGHVVKKLKSQIAVDINLAPRAYEEFQRDPAYKKMASAYAGKSFAPSATANIDETQIANYLERTRRVSTQAQSADVSRMLGGEKVGGGVGGALMMRGEEGNLANMIKDLGEVNILHDRELITEKQYEQRLEALKNKHAGLLNIIKEENKNRDMGVAIADRESERIKKTAHAGTSALRSILPESMARKLDSSAMFNKLADSEKAAASGRKGMSMGAQGASIGMEKVASALDKVLTAAGAASIAFSAIAKFIAILDDARKTQGAAIPALTSGSGQLANGYTNFANKVMTGNKALFWSLSQTDQYLPLVNASFGAMATMGYRVARSDEDLAKENLALASSYMQVGVMGKAFGKEFGESMEMASGFARALSLSGASVGSFFEKYTRMTNVARMSMDEFGASIGSVLDYSKMLGNDKAEMTIAAMAANVHDMQDNAKKLLALGAFKGLIGMDLTRQAGLAMAAGGRGGLAELQSSNNPLGVLTKSAGAMMQQIAQGLGGTESPEQRLGMATAAGQLIDPSVAKALFNVKGDLAKDELYKAITGTSGKSEAQINKLIEDAKKQYDPATIGADAMVKNTGTLEKIYLLLENIVRRGATNVIGQAMGLSSDYFRAEPGSDDGFNTKVPKGPS